MNPSFKSDMENIGIFFGLWSVPILLGMLVIGIIKGIIYLLT
tara:strand:+ start:170 stop:295 length:126 start_codon:yes stop_codon:yes gene_type:complete